MDCPLETYLTRYDTVPAKRSRKRAVPQNDTLHEPFLRRASDQEHDPGGGAALGGFLTMRLVDSLSQRMGRISAEGLHYQLRATADYLEELQPRTTEVNHLLEIVRIGESVLETKSPRLLWPPMLALAHWLEGELRLDEALDVLQTALCISDGRDAEEEVATYLQRGRVLREAGRFEEARESYVVGGEMAVAIGDRHSELLSRIGKAVVSQKVGNLREAEQMLRAVLEEARECEDRDAEARACHDLGITLESLGRSLEAVPLVFRAFELYEQRIQRLWALSDLGTLLKNMGHYVAARDALTIVQGSDVSAETRTNVGIELMDIAAYTDDRVAFERWRKKVQDTVEGSPYLEADFELKVGKGLLLFGKPRTAVVHLKAAMKIAEAADLNQLYFLAEKALEEVQSGTQPSKAAHDADSYVTHPEVHAVADRLHALRVSGAYS